MSPPDAFVFDIFADFMNLERLAVRRAFRD
jgi:hypothetical protein